MHAKCGSMIERTGHGIGDDFAVTASRRLSLLALFALSSACASAPPPAPPPVRHCAPRPPPPPPRPARPERPYDHVVIVSFDGMRPDGMERANAPTLHRLRAEGAYALRAETVEHSSTLPSHSSMLSGVEVSVHGMDFDEWRPRRGFLRGRTSLQLVHQAGMASAMFVAKIKLRHIALPGSLDVWSLAGHQCERVSTAAADYLGHAGNGLTFVHFGEPDVAGHQNGWMGARYLRAIRRADRCLSTVLRAVEARTDRTLLVVTADHGGHGRAHSTGTPVDRHIPWIAWGPGVRRGEFEDPMRTTDTAATVMLALGLRPPDDMSGHAVMAAFDPGVLVPEPEPLRAPPPPVEPGCEETAIAARPATSGSETTASLTPPSAPR